MKRVNRLWAQPHGRSSGAGDAPPHGQSGRACVADGGRHPVCLAQNLSGRRRMGDDPVPERAHFVPATLVFGNNVPVRELSYVEAHPCH
jgi:hypothetical protein